MSNAISFGSIILQEVEDKKLGVLQFPSAGMVILSFFSYILVIAARSILDKFIFSHRQNS
jgi:hypothetical protein